MRIILQALLVAVALLPGDPAPDASRDAGAGGLDGGAAPAPADAAAAKGQVIVDIAGGRSDRGIVGVVLYDGPDGFPTDPVKSVARAVVRLKKGAAQATFKDIPRGAYAAAVVHDENENGTLDFWPIGVPREGYGASNNVKVRFGAPRFEDARFAHDGSTTRLTVDIYYWSLMN
jgi:uncharacterized protein (DUF2141 family)